MATKKAVEEVEEVQEVEEVEEQAVESEKKTFSLSDLNKTARVIRARVVAEG